MGMRDLNEIFSELEEIIEEIRRWRLGGGETEPAGEDIDNDAEDAETSNDGIDAEV